MSKDVDGSGSRPGYAAVPRPVLEPGQLAIYGPGDVVHYRRDWASPKIREALTTAGYYVVGPVRRISAMLETLAGPCEHNVTINQDWARVDAT